MNDTPHAHHVDEPIWTGKCELRWRKVKDYTDIELCIGGVALGRVYPCSPDPWVVVFVPDNDRGNVFGGKWFATENEARDALVDAVVRELGK